MLPDPENRPTSGSEAVGVESVASDVVVELAVPVLGVRTSGQAAMRWASVPEASINEHCNLAPGKHNIGSRASRTSNVYRVVLPKSVTHPMEGPAHDQFRPGIRAAVALHRRTHGF